MAVVGFVQVGQRWQEVDCYRVEDAEDGKSAEVLATEMVGKITFDEWTKIAKDTGSVLPAGKSVVVLEFLLVGIAGPCPRGSSERAQAL